MSTQKFLSSLSSNTKIIVRSRIMETRVYPLTLILLQEITPHLLDIDTDTLGEPWAAQNFSYELPGKWNFSFYSEIDVKRISGFLIASRKDNSVHIHRLAVAKALRARGIGKKLVETVIDKTREARLNRITLKVSKSNIAAISFYKKLGFSICIDVGDNHFMELKLTH